MSRLRNAPAFLLPSLACLALGACGPDDTRLFDESGVWSLTHYSEDGSELFTLDKRTSQDAFMINFNRSKGVAAAAACSFGGSGSSNVPGSSTCRQGSGDQLEWECKCFSYEFEGSTIRMTEFAPGNAAPPVGSADTDGSGSGTTEVAVSEFGEVANSYNFTPLPGPSELDLDGLYGSNGVNSLFVFLKRFDGLFDESGCAQACFGE